MKRFHKNIIQNKQDEERKHNVLQNVEENGTVICLSTKRAVSTLRVPITTLLFCL